MTYKNETPKMQLMTQTDDRWAEQVMATPYEKFRDYGCLITALTNIINIIQKKNLTVMEIINEIKDNKLFAGMKYSGIEEGKKSFLLTDDFLRFHGLKKQKVSGWIDEKVHYCRVEVKTRKGTWIGHYTNLFKIKNDFFVFDVYDGSFVKVPESAILEYFIVEVI